MRQRKSLKKGGEIKVPETLYAIKSGELEPLYDKDYIVARYGITMNTLNQWISKGKIPYVKIGKLVKFKESLLLTWEKGSTHKATKDNEIQRDVR